MSRPTKQSALQIALTALGEVLRLQKRIEVLEARSPAVPQIVYVDRNPAYLPPIFQHPGWPVSLPVTCGNIPREVS